MNPSASSIEAESALVRSQLVSVGADIRNHADPTILVDAAKASFQRRANSAPSFMKENAKPLSLILMGGAFGAIVTGLFSSPRRARAVVPTGGKTETPKGGSAAPSLGSNLNAALLSSVGVGLGYVAGMFVPSTATEERFLGEPKALLSEHLDAFLNQNAQGMKAAVANMFGISRWSAATLIGLAMLAEGLGISSKPATPEPL